MRSSASETFPAPTILLVMLVFDETTTFASGIGLPRGVGALPVQIRTTSFWSSVAPSMGRLLGATLTWQLNAPCAFAEELHNPSKTPTTANVKTHFRVGRAISISIRGRFKLLVGRRSRVFTRVSVTRSVTSLANGAELRSNAELVPSAYGQLGPNSWVIASETIYELRIMGITYRSVPLLTDDSADTGIANAEGCGYFVGRVVVWEACAAQAPDRHARRRHSRKTDVTSTLAERAPEPCAAKAG
jgi:hypothetical protein